MKKITIIVLALLAVLVVAPWGIGRLAEQRVNAGLDRIVLEAPYLSIVERNWTRGWFRSEQQVTFEVVGPWARAMNPATVLEDFKKAQAEGEAAMAAEEAAQAAPADSGPAPAAEPDATAPETPAEAAPIPPIRFTIRNEILHGPVLWPASLGIARVNTKLDLGPEGAQEDHGDIRHRRARAHEHARRVPGRRHDAFLRRWPLDQVQGRWRHARVRRLQAGHQLLRQSGRHRARRQLAALRRLQSGRQQGRDGQDDA